MSIDPDPWCYGTGRPVPTTLATMDAATTATVQSTGGARGSHPCHTNGVEGYETLWGTGSPPPSDPRLYWGAAL